MSKYICKRGEADGEDVEGVWSLPGRWWGIIGRRDLPRSAPQTVELSERDLHRFRRVMARSTRYLQADGRLSRAAPWARLRGRGVGLLVLVAPGMAVQLARWAGELAARSAWVRDAAAALA
jgi:hypothetical protein